MPFVEVRTYPCATGFLLEPGVRIGAGPILEANLGDHHVRSSERVPSGLPRRRKTAASHFLAFAMCNKTSPFQTTILMVESLRSTAPRNEHRAIKSTARYRLSQGNERHKENPPQGITGGASPGSIKTVNITICNKFCKLNIT